MLYYILIALLTVSVIAVLVFPSYRIFDPIYGYSGKGGFDYQNCQLDGTCWVQPNNTGANVPKIPLSPPKMAWNSIHIRDDMKGIQLPPVFF